MATKLLNKNFVLLLQGQFVSQIGSAVYMLALIFWLKQETESASVIGLLVMVGMLPGVILGPLGGTFADYYSRKKIIVVSDLINGCVLLAVALAMLNAPDERELTIALLFLATITSGVVGAFFRPAISAAIPDLVPHDKLDAANGIMQGILRTSLLLGQSIGGVLFRAVGAPLLMLLDGLSYLFSALSELFIDIPQPSAPKQSVWRDTFRAFKVNTIEGFRFVRQSAGLRTLFIVASVVSFFTAPISVLFPFFIEDTLQAAPDWYGYVIAGMSAGTIAGSLLAGLVRIDAAHRSRVAITNLALFSLSICVVSICTDVVPVLLIMIFVGVCSGVQGVLIASTLQSCIPADLRGRVFGLLGTIMTALTPVSMGLVGIAADALNKNVPLLFLIAGLLSLAMSPFLLFNKAFHALLTGKAYPKPATSPLEAV